MDVAPPAATLDVADVSVAVVALLIHESACGVHLGARARAARDVVETSIGTDVAEWLAGDPPDGEQVLFLVDTMRSHCAEHITFLASMDSLVIADADAVAALRAVGTSCRERRQWDAALHAYRTWLRLATARQDVAERASALHCLSALHAEMGSYADALSCYGQLRNLLVAGGDLVRAAEVLTDVGLLHNAAGRPQQAVRCLERAVLELGGAGAVASARALLGIARVHREQGLRADALLALQRCLALATAGAEGTLTSMLRSELAQLCEDEGRLEEASALHALTKRDQRSRGDVAAGAQTSRRLARVNLLRSRPREAAAHYLDSLCVPTAAQSLGATPLMTAADADAAAAALHLVATSGPVAVEPCDADHVIATLAAPLFRSA